MPIIWGSAIAGAGALGGGALSYFGAKDSAKSASKAAQAYINYLQGQRQTFLDQPEVGPIRARLGAYSRGELPTEMSNQIGEDYGRSLADLTRLAPKAGVQPGGAYTPGRRDRTARMLGENIAANKANTMRAAKQEGERYAISALPTYMPGLPATPTADPGTYMTGAGGNTPSPFSFAGPALSQAGQYGGMGLAAGPILDRLYPKRSPINDANADIWRYADPTGYTNTPFFQSQPSPWT